MEIRYAACVKKQTDFALKVYLHTLLDSAFAGAYNPSHSGVVSFDQLIEKEMHGGSLRREAALKSPGCTDEERLCSVDRHGNARYSIG